ncbi:hypothetical protein MHK_004413 [Candidatus Magnetomorum sp. HK-1]|nr:hypothetical protein MHK_004413 [Candidatus Magnetomorum sp. HK-1]
MSCFGTKKVIIKVKDLPLRSQSLSTKRMNSIFGGMDVYFDPYASNASNASVRDQTQIAVAKITMSQYSQTATQLISAIKGFQPTHVGENVAIDV